MFAFIKTAAAGLVLGTVALSAGMARADVELKAGGATFPDPIYQKWVKDYSSAHSGTQIGYAAKGSGAGISGLLDKTYDFCGSDAPMNADELKKAQAAGGEVVQIPSVAGAVVMAYNIPGYNGELHLSGPVIANIYLGKVTKWNDKAITDLNPGVTLPSTAITTVHRSDGSGTNFVFTSYLCSKSPDFQTKVNFGKTVNWPGGQGAQGTAGVTQTIQKIDGAVGYVELNYAIENHINFALVKNDSGKYVKASPESVSAAGEGAVKDMDDQKTLAVSIWSEEGDKVYPISSFTYLMCYKDLSYLKDKAKAQAVVDFFWYATHDGQAQAPGMTYAPLSKGVQQRVEKALEGIMFNGAPLHPASM